ncbi:MAG: toll/interleukin-1 receptor domain-containing protein [Salinivirgaceae bacterium]|nr:toll/interleukin-1 receptor domain-containing protein [Salinivirgaceae bacterium]
MSKSSQLKVVNERGWAKLLSEIKKGNVVPIIGNELLKINVKGERILLREYLVKQLAKKIDVAYHEGLSFTDLCCDTCNANWNKVDSDPYYEVYQILQNIDLEVPESLNKLFEIEEFRIVLTTTFDNLVEKALAQRKGKDKVKSYYYEKRTNGQDIYNVDDVIVYQMFGKPDVIQNSYVLTEDDLLEFLHLWLNDEWKPKNLSRILSEKYLLVIGCNYPNWLFRFFLHSMKSNMNTIPEKKMGMIADSQIDEDLVTFLSRIDAQMHDDAERFIDELVFRYKSCTKSEVKNEVFISYASEDENIASQIVNAFKKNNIGVWFDKKELEPADEYVKKIKSNIQDSKIFVPILSRNVLTPERRFFRAEWNWAIEETVYRPASFIYPIVIDDMDVQHNHIPREISCLQTVDYNSSEFEDNLKKVIRNTRR